MNHPRRDQGNVTIWSLALTLLLVLVGWFGLTLWAAVAARNEIATAADLAAQAGATALDRDEFRATGARRLDPNEAGDRARDVLVAHGVFDQSTVVATPERITVTVVDEVGLGFLKLVGDTDEPLQFQISAVAAPSD